MKDRTKKALEDLLGQVKQARDGFGIYQQSKSMDSAVAEAEAALAEPSSDPRAKLESLRELSEKATAGEWHGDPEPYVEYIWGPNEEMVAQIRGYGAGLPMRWNRDFIVACVNAVRAILKGKD